MRVTSRGKNGFDARYKGVYFDEEYADGKLSSLHGSRLNILTSIRNLTAIRILS